MFTKKEPKLKDEELFAKFMKEIELVTQLVEQSTSNPAIKNTPRFIKNGELRDYQLVGVNWLIALHNNNLHGILADEMGLGKTLQTISFLGYLKHVKKINGPHLILTPKSTIPSWGRECEKWCPSLSIYLNQQTGTIPTSRIERQRQLREAILAKNDVIITTYDLFMNDYSIFKSSKRPFYYMIIDEGHRLKNNNAQLCKLMRKYNMSKYRLLLTGTPIQNNLEELWSLLNFLMPERFDSLENFNSWFSFDDCLTNDDVTHDLQKVLKPLVLHRTKAIVEPDLLPKIIHDVYVPLTSMQRDLYRKALLKELYNMRMGLVSAQKLNSMLMQCRKSCLHPYLFDGVEDDPPLTSELDHLVHNSGKMFFLDQMLKLLYKKNSRVLLFSFMTRMLDIIEDYCVWRGYQYLRLDGSTKTEERIAGMNQFNSKGSPIFIYLISTRAGGQGINLQTADTVIFYDIDWNPQVDLQAMDRAHRIGQKKQLRVYRLIAENTVEEKIFERACLKMVLNERVIKKNHIRTSHRNVLIECLGFGADYQINNTEKVDLKKLKINAQKILQEGHAKQHEIDNDKENYKAYRNTVKNNNTNNNNNNSATEVNNNLEMPRPKRHRPNNFIYTILNRLF